MNEHTTFSVKIEAGCCLIPEPNVSPTLVFLRMFYDHQMGFLAPMGFMNNLKASSKYIPPATACPDKLPPGDGHLLWPL